MRLNDNAALYHALKENKNVLPVFIFDAEILSGLENKADRRVDFIHQALQHIQQQLVQLKSSLRVFICKPEEAFKQLMNEYKLKKVYTNHDYEPYAIERDEAIKKLLEKNHIDFYTYKDQCIFEKLEVTKDDGKPYTIFTPYSKKWKSKLNSFYYKSYPTEKYFDNFFKSKAFAFPKLNEVGFIKTDVLFNPEATVSENILINYKAQRDFPFLNGTSKLSIYLRFGAISIRKLVQLSLRKQNDIGYQTWLNELIWRDFYMMILANFPHVTKGAFKKEYDFIKWELNENDFLKWCKGKTGFPIVDAGMRELNETGFMHNRVRMIVSSFLVKDLLIDWRWGEAYFAEKLNDFDLSANNGGWQWAAGTGCDAAPYFRIFNPTEQQKRFDPELIYIKKWIPEYGTSNYPEPMIDHAFARKRTLERYKVLLEDRKQLKVF